MNSNLAIGLAVLLVILAVIRTAIAISRMRRAPRQATANGNFWVGCTLGVLLGIVIMIAFTFIYPLLASRFK